MSSKEKNGAQKASPTVEPSSKKSKKGEETAPRGLSMEEWRSAMNGEGAPSALTGPAETTAGAVHILSSMSVTVTMQAMLNVFAQSINDGIAKIGSRLEKIEAKVGRIPTIEAEIKTLVEKTEDLQRAIDEIPRETEEVDSEAPRAKEQSQPVVSVDAIGPDGERQRPAGNSRRSRSPGKRSRSPAQKKRRVSPVRRSLERAPRSSACIFCTNPGHESDGCTKISSGRIRREVAMRRGLCMGCGSASCKMFECNSSCAYCEEAAKDNLSLGPGVRLEQLIRHGSIFCTLPSLQFNHRKRF